VGGRKIRRTCRDHATTSAIKATFHGMGDQWCRRIDHRPLSHKGGIHTKMTELILVVTGGIRDGEGIPGTRKTRNVFWAFRRPAHYGRWWANVVTDWEFWRASDEPIRHSIQAYFTHYMILSAEAGPRLTEDLHVTKPGDDVDNAAKMAPFQKNVTLMTVCWLRILTYLWRINLQLLWYWTSILRIDGWKARPGSYSELTNLTVIDYSLRISDWFGGSPSGNYGRGPFITAGEPVFDRAVCIPRCWRFPRPYVTNRTVRKAVAPTTAFCLPREPATGSPPYIPCIPVTGHLSIWRLLPGIVDQLSVAFRTGDCSWFRVDGDYSIDRPWLVTSCPVCYSDYDSPGRPSRYRWRCYCCWRSMGTVLAVVDCDYILLFNYTFVTLINCWRWHLIVDTTICAICAHW